MTPPAPSCAPLLHQSRRAGDHGPSVNSQSRFNIAFFVALCAQVVLAACFGYWRIFQLFADYDDEGYTMITVKQFLEGHPLYDQVFTSYGPGYYFYKYILQLGGRVAVTHDYVRFAALGAWLVISLLCAWAVFRFTKSAAVSLLTQWLTFITVGRGICTEPGHPQEVCGLLVALVFLAIVMSAGALRYAMFFFGSALVALLLIKINIGIFLAIALLLSFLACSTRTIISRAASIACAVGALALPFVLVRTQLHDRAALNLSLMITLSTVGLLIAANKTGAPLLKSRDWGLFMVSCFASALVISGFAIVRGSTVSMVASGVLLQPMRRVGTFVLLLPVTKFAVLGAAAAAASAAWLVLQSKAEDPPVSLGPPLLVLAGEKTIWSAPTLLLLKGVFAIAIIVCAVLGEFVLLMELACPLLWLVLVTPNSEPPARRFQRIALATVALFQLLIAYPIAGSQVFFAVLPALIVAAVCLHDFANGVPWQNMSTRMPIFTMLVASVLVAGHAIHKTSDARKQYAANPPLNLPGASRLRLSPVTTLRFQWLIKALRANGGRFITLPGMYSLYFWAQQDPPTGLNLTQWMNVLNDAQQHQIVNAVASDEKLAIIYSPELVRFWERPSIGSGPLVSYIQTNFEAVAQCQSYEFMIRKGRILSRAARNALETECRLRID